MAKQKQILDIASYAGEIILTNGAEIYRTEETINSICQAYGMKYVQSIVTPTGIFISIDQGYTKVSRIHNRQINLDTISQINDFSRQLTTETIAYQPAMTQLNQIESSSNTYSLPLVILASSIASSMYVILAQGSYLDLLPAFIASLGAQLFIKLSGFFKEVNFIPELIAGFIAGLITNLFYQSGIGENLSIITVSGILSFVPGVTVTNAIRDAINGDLISATSRGIEVILVAINLAVGVAMALGVFY
ncbi:threonine/serine exporter family protein [Halanaerobaculum tunisiense]